ncbi:MAG: damage-inducible protein DinB [Bacteroidota bacterium]|nr:damage-inducible protein DinB [Bacteroidota bacterium]
MAVMAFQYQYALVKASRKVLLEYCKTLFYQDFIVEQSTFGRGSIRNLLVHIGNTYEFWIGRHCLHKDIQFTEYYSVKSAIEAEDFFDTIDVLVEAFINVYAENYLMEKEITLTDKVLLASPLKVFTHVITHEFHHKGQILSLSRQLGYVPVDTDIIR